MLNQNYRERHVVTATGVKVQRNCRVALGNTAKHCEVDSEFRCILLEEEQDLNLADPPRLNRCEKHRLTYHDVLTEFGGSAGTLLLAELQSFCQKISSFKGQESITVRDTFLGFTEDTLPSLLIREILGNNDDLHAIHTSCIQTLLDLMPSHAVARAALSCFGADPENEEKLHQVARTCT